MEIVEYIELVLKKSEHMFTTVTNEGHGSTLLVFLIGIVFGAIIQYSRVDKFEKIAGFAMGKDTIVPKMLFFAIGLSAIFLFLAIKFGYAHYHIKPIKLGGLVVGGVLFGISMAILGKCPGTGPISIAEGRIDVLVGAIGGLFGGYVFTKYYDSFFNPLMGDSLGKGKLIDVAGDYQALSMFVFGLALIIIAFALPKLELYDEADLKKLSDEERPDR